MVNRLTSKEIRTPLLEEVLAQSIEFRGDSPLFEIYAVCLQLFTNFEERQYRLFKKLVFNNLDQLSQQEQVSIFTLLINHTAHAMRIDKNFNKDALEIYRFGMTHSLLEEDGHIVMNHFINYVNMLCSEGRTRTANLFVNEFSKKLDGTVREQIVKIALSRILLTEKKYKEAFSTLYKKGFKNLQLRLMARVNRLVACYEWHIHGDEDMEIEGNLIFIDDETEAFRKGLSRIKSSMGDKSEVILANLNFSKFLRLLIQQGKEQDVESAKALLREKLKEYNYLILRTWLEEKIEEL